MAVVCAAAAAQRIDVREATQQFGIVLAKLLRVALIELGEIVELGVTLP